MLKEYHKHSIPQKIIDEVINDYNSRDKYQTTTMNKADPGPSLPLMLPYIQLILGNDIEYRSGNFYKHTQPYLPHTDYRIDQDNTINVVIPLSYTGTMANLVVFDQSWHKDSVTWCLSNKVIEFAINTGVIGRPADYVDVIGLTNQPIPDHLYTNFLTHYEKEMFFGLTGEAFPSEPTSVIVFDNRLIHCTSNFSGEKLGLSLRFKRK